MSIFSFSGMFVGHHCYAHTSNNCCSRELAHCKFAGCRSVATSTMVKPVYTGHCVRQPFPENSRPPNSTKTLQSTSIIHPQLAGCLGGFRCTISLVLGKRLGILSLHAVLYTVRTRRVPGTGMCRKLILATHWIGHHHRHAKVPLCAYAITDADS